MRDILLGGLILSLVLIYRRRTKEQAENPQGLPHPPGPKPLPLLGNVLQLPMSGSWHLYTKWQKTYGNLGYRSHQNLRPKYRVRAELTGELMGWSDTLPFMKYGSRWRRHRKIMHSGLHSGATHPRTFLNCCACI
ncbi:hypothetical protein BOTBODRAFT_336558 [Botryobasidium botryosum FD-172 SS1]|uniref:Cytochrome P450 n=1 Tax=Botryobasidium botryosum (strain FD-172 SS1) TaxID=930990 RepID=A0A067MIS6_BOTB1|nr:hypothetical protein BOTBODRAFT_336558 [Botryobasidium botryosum FD-172 SS1]